MPDKGKVSEYGVKARRPVVYILASPNGRALYVGVTTDLGRRLEEHRRGMSIHTATYNITKLVYIESHETAPDADRTRKADQTMATGKESRVDRCSKPRMARPFE